MRVLTKDQEKWLRSLTEEEMDYFQGFYTDEEGNLRMLNRQEGDTFTVAGRTFKVGRTITVGGGAGQPPSKPLKWYQKIW